MKSAFLLGLIVFSATVFSANGLAKTQPANSDCASEKRIVIAAVGDLLFHKKLQVQAYRKGGSFRKFFMPMLEQLRKADFTYGNLEGPAARAVAGFGRAVKDPGKRYGPVYGAPLKSLSFNYHPSVATDLKWVGFDIVSTANNHALDRGPLGIDRTIETLEKAGLPFTGTRKRGENYSKRKWSVITKNSKASIAWLACTYSTNGLRDRHGQVLRCYQDSGVVLAQIQQLADDPKIDAVILTPHWGIENSHRPLKRARALARAAINAGATAVLGAHPHVLQPWENYTARDGRKGVIVYSMGNFISNQRKLMQRAGVIVYLELFKNNKSKARLGSVEFLPTWVVIDHKGHRVVENKGKGWSRSALKQTRRLLALKKSLPEKPARVAANTCAQ